ncbi:MAG: hypothetical protein OZ929_20850 [Bryobacterales bacterium]|nr:hypothetical protein [Bryobacterales bacterium]
MIAQTIIEAEHVRKVTRQPGRVVHKEAIERRGLSLGVFQKRTQGIPSG